MSSEEAIEQMGIPTADFHDERIDMAYWYPKLQQLDVPLPRTRALPLERDENGLPVWDTQTAKEIVEELGGEAFVRSGYKSAQLDMSGSHIPSPDEDLVELTIMELVGQHAMMQMPLGESLWLREYLDVEFCHYCRDNLVPEVRVFIRDGEIACHHPRLEGFDGQEHHRELAVEYIDTAWPPAMEDDFRNHDGLETYAQRVANVLDGWWSVDFVMDTWGDWWLTDMALDGLYERDGVWRNISEHAAGCENNLQEEYENE